MLAAVQLRVAQWVVLRMQYKPYARSFQAYNETGLATSLASFYDTISAGGCSRQPFMITNDSSVPFSANPLMLSLSSLA